MAVNAETHQQLSYEKYPPEILKLPMFHANISTREDAEKYLDQHQQGDGSFFFRPNQASYPSVLSTTVRAPNGRPYHARVYITKKHHGRIEYHIADSMRFDSFDKLLQHYQKHRIVCKEGIENMKLLIPLTHQRAEKFKMKKVMMCQPPPPLPLKECEKDMENYYSIVQSEPRYYKHVLQARNTTEDGLCGSSDLADPKEICSCGIRLKDSHLPSGYSLHYSQYEATPVSCRRIFFKDRQGSATWDLAAAIIPRLSFEQINLILYLCKVTQCPVPENLRKYVDRKMRKDQKQNKCPRMTTPKVDVEKLQVSGRNIPDEGRQLTFSQKPSILISSLPGSPTTPEKELINLTSEQLLLSRKDCPDHSRDGALLSPGKLAIRNKELGQTLNRPMSFGSTPTTVIPSKAGSPLSPKKS